MANDFAYTYHPESFISPVTSTDGLLRSAKPDRTVWLYGRIPWSSALLDGADDRTRIDQSNALLSFFYGLAGMVPQAALKYRALLSSEYREFHLLVGSMPIPYSPPKSDGRYGRYADLAGYQSYYYRHDKIRKQFAVIGVPLRPGGRKPRHGRKESMLSRTLSAFDNMCSNIANGCAKWDEYETDREKVANVMKNAGIIPFTDMEENERRRLIAMLESWWVSRANSPVLPILAESDHLHFFAAPPSCIHAKRMYDDGVNCEQWNINGEYPATICFARTSSFSESPVSDPANLWIAQLMEDYRAGGANAIGVSVRGKVEPSVVTADTMRRNQHAVDDAIRERYEKGRETPGDMEELQANINRQRDKYIGGGMPPTIIDMSVAACVAGNSHMAIDALSNVPRIEFVTLPTANEQIMAFKSMQACSPIRMTPYTMHQTATVVSGSGVSSLARAGDRNGAKLGDTEANRQPVYIDTTTVQDADREPYMLVIAKTGAGKALYIYSTIPVPPQPRFPQGGTPRVIDLKEGDLVYGRDGKAYPIQQLHPIHTEDLYEVTLSDGQKIKASGDHQWVVSSFKDRNAAGTPAHLESIRRRDRFRDAQRRLHDIALSRPEDERLTLREIADLTEPVFREWSDGMEPKQYVADVLRFMGTPVAKETRVDKLRNSAEAFMTRKRDSLTSTVNVYNARQAIEAIGMRNMLRYENADDDPDGYAEQVVTTREMLDSGLTTPTGASMWSIHAAKPVEGVEQELPLDPWVFGAWLADGNKSSGIFTSDGRNGDLQYLSDRLTVQGFKVKPMQGSVKEISVTGIRTILRSMGVLNNKHIPEQYLNASIPQRLALVQGMLDQDGTIDDDGSVEFTQSADHEDIMRGMVRLLRSLGVIVKEPRLAASGYTLDGEHHETQGRWHINFTTSLPVFTLPRKKAKLPEKTRRTQQWLYVTDIRKTEDAPHRCLTVDSPDHTFLVGGYVPTHNTMALFNLCVQWARIDARVGQGKTPVIYINPKQGDDLEDATRSQGGVVIRLDKDIANGTFDPLNLLDPENAKETAAIMLSDILHPDGADAADEITLTAMLDYGINHGAKCCGIALQLAAQAFAEEKKNGRDPRNIGLPDNTFDVYQQVSMVIRTNQSARLIFGTRDGMQPLKVSQGLTLINAGERNLVPEPGSENTLTGRIQQWVLRMVVMGAGAAVRGRDGMVCLDEAWVAMGKGKGTAQTLRQWGRMARSQRFTPVLASQKVQEFIDAGLTGAISRAILMSLDDPEETNGNVSEAKAALRLLEISDPSGHIRRRMAQSDVKGSGGDETDGDEKKKTSGPPNWLSLRRLRDPKTGKTIRGTVCYFVDGKNQPVPVEIIIPEDLLKEISTTATDKIAREQRKSKQPTSKEQA